jgi:hypothetical protein
MICVCSAQTSPKISRVCRPGEIGFASAVKIFFPQQYVRTTGAPDVYTDTLTTNLERLKQAVEYKEN